MYIGPFYFDTKELFLVFAAILIVVVRAFGWQIWWFSTTDLLTLVVLILITKGLLPAIHNEAFFILAISAVFLTVFLPLWTVVLYYFMSFLLLRVFKIV